MSKWDTNAVTFTTTTPWSRCASAYTPGKPAYQAYARVVDAIEDQGLVVPCPVCGRQVIRAEERYTSGVANLQVRFEDHFVERWYGHCPCGAELNIVCNYNLSSSAYFGA